MKVWQIVSNKHRRRVLRLDVLSGAWYHPRVFWLAMLWDPEQVGAQTKKSSINKFWCSWTFAFPHFLMVTTPSAASSCSNLLSCWRQDWQDQQHLQDWQGAGPKWGLFGHHFGSILVPWGHLGDTWGTMEATGRPQGGPSFIGWRKAVFRAIGVAVARH